MASNSFILLALFTFSTGLLVSVNGWTVNATGSAMTVGSDGTFQCHISAGVDVMSVTILNDDTKYVQTKNKDTLLINPSSVNSRYSFDMNSSTLTVSSLECGDDKLFTCIVQAAVPNVGLVDKTAEARVIVKVPPKEPSQMTFSPSNIPGDLDENSEFSAVCMANIGRPGKGKIEWKIFLDNNEIDPREEIYGNISESVVSRNSDDLACTQRKRSTLRVRTKFPNQKVVVACFVVNEDFPKDQTNCDSVETSLCQQSKTFMILYKVRNISVSREPQGDIINGTSLTLRCSAQGYPIPTYTWSKVGDNHTLTPVMNGDVSQLVLTDVDKHRDTGNYSCTASNTIDISDKVEVNIVDLPPTTTPDPASSSNPGGATGPNSSTEDNGYAANKNGGDDGVLIAVGVVVAVVAFVVIAIVAVCVWKKRKGHKEDPPRPNNISFYNNKAMMGAPPDVLADKKKQAMSGSLNNSFDMRSEEGYEDGLRYADLTYDNRPRSRKPMAIGDAASDYSDVQMPQV